MFRRNVKAIHQIVVKVAEVSCPHPLSVMVIHSIVVDIFQGGQENSSMIDSGSDDSYLQSLVSSFFSSVTWDMHVDQGQQLSPFLERREIRPFLASSSLDSHLCIGKTQTL